MNDKTHFMVCIRNDGYEGELELRKLYEVIADPSAERHAQVRVVDESGEDYLYPAAWFLPVEVSPTAEEQLLNLATK
jgi:hypothetical protein